MSTLTLSIPDELKAEMDKTQYINWSEVARAAIKDKVEKLKLFEQIVSKSKLTEDDALELGRKVRKGIHGRHVKEYGGKN